jgi:hypothetical protein
MCPDMRRPPGIRHARPALCLCAVLRWCLNCAVAHVVTLCVLCLTMPDPDVLRNVSSGGRSVRHDVSRAVRARSVFRQPSMLR